MSIHYYSCINDSPHTLIMELNMQAYFDQLDRVRYEGPKTTNPLAFRHYNPDELVLGKRMEDHLRFAAFYWHTFCWNGADMFGVGSFDRPWQQPGEAIELAKTFGGTDGHKFVNGVLDKLSLIARPAETGA